MSLTFVRSQTERRTLHKFRLSHNLHLFLNLSSHQPELRQHQSTRRETDTVVQHAQLLRHHTLRHTLERLLQLAARRAHITGNNHLEILTTTDTTSRVILQQHACLFMNPSGRNEHEVRSLSIDLEIDGPTR